jgi:hypothetical protein
VKLSSATANPGITKVRPLLDGLVAQSRPVQLVVNQKRGRGQPKAFATVEALEAACDEYFEKMQKEKRPTTMSGLAVHLGVDRTTLFNYSKDDEYFNTIKRAKARVEANMEEGALTGQLNPTVTIFSMKNNFGYSNDGGVADSPPPAQVTNNTQVNVVADSSQGRQIADKFVDFFSKQTIQAQPDIIEGEIAREN